ncbi:MAG: hypothetical protein ACRDHG_00405 [Anaerolineales bacterium]
MTVRAGTIALFTSIAIAGCNAPNRALPTASETAPASTLGSADAPSSFEFDSIVLLPGAAPGDWDVIGMLRNSSGLGAANIQIRVALANGGGEKLAELDTSPLMATLAAGEASPFAAEFLGVGPALTVEARVDSFRPGFIRRSRLEIEVLEEFVTESGELALLGIVSNPGSLPQSFVSLGLVGFGPASQPVSFAPLRYGPRVIGRGEAVPFLAVADGNPGQLRWQSYHDAVEVEALVLNSLAMDEPPRLRVDSQGKSFVVGSVRNEAGVPAQARVLLILWDGDRIASLTELEAPLPLPAGERLAFAAQDFPGLSRPLAESVPANLRIESRIEAAAQVGRPMVLQAEVEAFHSVGSTLFLRGILRNDTPRTVEPAAVFAELRSTDGELLSAGWFTAPGPLASGEQAVFVIDLPLPMGTDPGEFEFDLRALGSPLKAEG